MSTLHQVLLLLAAFIVLALLLWRIEKRAKAKEIERAFAGRTPLDAETFYERYFQAKGIPPHVVTGVRRILEQELDADLSRLADEDDFSKNLRFFWHYDSMAGCVVLAALEKEFNIQISDAEAATMTTVRDIVQKVWEKEREKSAAAVG